MHSSVFLMWTPGPMELVIILIIALVLFGNRIPTVARSMGRGITEFKQGLNDPGDTEPDEIPEQAESGREEN